MDTTTTPAVGHNDDASLEDLCESYVRRIEELEAHAADAWRRYHNLRWATAMRTARLALEGVQDSVAEMLDLAFEEETSTALTRAEAHVTDALCILSKVDCD